MSSIISASGFEGPWNAPLIPMQPNPRADTSNPSGPSFTLGTVGRIPDSADAITHTQETQARMLLSSTTATATKKCPCHKTKLNSKSENQVWHQVDAHCKWEQLVYKSKKTKNIYIYKQKCKAATSGRTFNPEPI